MSLKASVTTYRCLTSPVGVTPSLSEMYRAAKRFKRRTGGVGGPREVVLLHLGDHDPSGIDMTRDLGAKLSLLDAHPFDIRRLALNMDQIEQQQPPPNPAKVSDSRYQSYVENYGEESWELDSLEPSYIAGLIRDEVDALIERDPWNAVMVSDRASRATLRRS